MLAGLFDGLISRICWPGVRLRSILVLPGGAALVVAPLVGGESGGRLEWFGLRRGLQGMPQAVDLLGLIVPIHPSSCKENWFEPVIGDVSGLF